MISRRLNSGFQPKYSGTRIQGLNEVLGKLNREIQKIEGACNKGLIEAMIIVRRDMDETPPKIPVDLGNLRHSWFSVTTKSKGATSAKFKGDNAGAMQSDHSTTVSQAWAIANNTVYPKIVFGFSANYAAPVHEMMLSPSGKPIHWSKSGSGPKFLEAALKRNEKRILKIIRDNAEIL